jgi:phosphohistidine phosphatase
VSPPRHAMRRLTLMRHAQAEQSAETDQARRLTDRGRRDARAAGRLLADRGEAPQLALVSTATRTRETWELVCAALAPQHQAWFDATLYDGGGPVVVELLAAVQPDVRSVIVVGHDPTMSVAAAAFSDGLGEPGTEAAVGRGLPTAAVVCFDVPVAWEDVNAGRLRLTSVDVPRG